MVDCSICRCSNWTSFVSAAVSRSWNRSSKDNCAAGLDAISSISFWLKTSALKMRSRSSEIGTATPWSLTTCTVSFAARPAVYTMSVLVRRSTLIRPAPRFAFTRVSSTRNRCGFDLGSGVSPRPNRRNSSAVVFPAPRPPIKQLSPSAKSSCTPPRNPPVTRRRTKVWCGTRLAFVSSTLMSSDSLGEIGRPRFRQVKQSPAQGAHGSEAAPTGPPDRSTSLLARLGRAEGDRLTADPAARRGVVVRGRDLDERRDGERDEGGTDD